MDRSTYTHMHTRMDFQVDAFFIECYDIKVPKEDGNRDKCYISRSYDATSHFEGTSDDVMGEASLLNGAGVSVVI